MKKLAFIVGRFQPFHKGHQHLIDNALSFDKIILFLGSSQEYKTKKNPFSFDERKEIIHSYYKLEKISFVPLQDKSCDIEWINQIKNELDKYQTEYEITFICCNKDDSTTKSNDLFDLLNTKKVVVNLGYDIDATTIRKKIFDDIIDVENIDDLHDITKLFLKKYLQNNTLIV